MNDAIIEAAARALQDWSDPAEARRVAAAVLAAVTPLIRADVLKEAAAAIYANALLSLDNAQEAARCVRTLKDKP